jgi:hypothetical protein
MEEMNNNIFLEHWHAFLTKAIVAGEDEHGTQCI